MRSYKKTILSINMLGGLMVNFFVSFGFLALILGVLDIFWPNKFNLELLGLGIMFIVSILYAVIFSWPKFSIFRSFTIPDTKITIRVGDLYNETGHLVIGMNDVFDTEIGEVISKNSLQAQFLERVYRNDKSRFDRDIEKSLLNQRVNFITDKAKMVGKNKRYPLGTVAVIDGENKKYFCVAYSKMGVDLMAHSDVGIIWNSLEKLWDIIRLHGEQMRISMPIIGSDLARVIGVSHYTLIEMILLSFIINSRIKPITKDFVLVIHPNNLEKVNFMEIKNFIKSL